MSPSLTGVTRTPYQGISLVELLIVLSVSGILFLVALPSNQASVIKNQLRQRSDELTRAIEFAKLQAVHQQKTLILSPMPPTYDWSLGMILFVEKGSNQQSDAQEIIRVWDWRASANQVHWHGFHGENELRFAKEMQHNVLSGYFMIQQNARGIKLVVNRLGRIRQESQ